MEKQKKTAQELANMISERLGIGGIFVAVHKDTVYGWHPQIVTSPAAAINAQVAAEAIAKELREEYELKE